MSERDDTLEQAAQAIEQPDISDWVGCMSKTKKGQREYEIRRQTVHDVKKRMAEYIRSFKSGRGNDALVALERIVDAPPVQHDMHVRDAWPLADLGWLDIFVTLQANHNGIPPHASYRFELTDRGKRILEEHRIGERDATES